MTYSLDLRERVVSFVKSGASKAEASRRFSIAERTVHYWVARPDLCSKKHSLRHRKIDKVALIKHMESHNDLLLRERAAHFGVHISSLSRALRKLGYRKKKNADI